MGNLSVYIGLSLGGGLMRESRANLQKASPASSASLDLTLQAVV